MDSNLIDKIKAFWASLDSTAKAILLGGAVVLILYFIMSPYQNCKRDGVATGFCHINTTW
jgi:hypothetical protein